ncbi:mediator of RNA polymerase II transcription subunit, partial [Striga asiatica]
SRIQGIGQLGIRVPEPLKDPLLPRINSSKSLYHKEDSTSGSEHNWLLGKISSRTPRSIGLKGRADQGLRNRNTKASYMRRHLRDVYLDLSSELEGKIPELGKVRTGASHTADDKDSFLLFPVPKTDYPSPGFTPNKSRRKGTSPAFQEAIYGIVFCSYLRNSLSSFVIMLGERCQKERRREWIPALRYPEKKALRPLASVEDSLAQLV